MLRAAALPTVLICLGLLTASPPIQEAPDPTDDPRAVELLARMRERLAGVSFAAAATLRIERPGRERELLLRLYRDAPDRWLLRADGPVREKGTRILLADGRAHIWFPRAELTLELPTSLGNERLFGSDFALDDLGALVADPARYAARLDGSTTHDGIPALRVTLLPREPAASLYGAVRLLLAEQNAAPMQMEFVSERGDVVRRVRLEGYEALPRRWIATIPGRPGWRSEIEVRFFEGSPHFDDSLFTVEGLAR